MILILSRRYTKCLDCQLFFLKHLIYDHCIKQINMKPDVMSLFSKGSPERFEQLIYRLVLEHQEEMGFKYTSYIAFISAKYIKQGHICLQFFNVK